MTRNESLKRIMEVEAELFEAVGHRINIHGDDARRLIDYLPNEMLVTDRPSRIDPGGDRASIELLWSRSANMFNPGNHITAFITRGDGSFWVRSTSSDSIAWQRQVDGTPMTNMLSLQEDGARELIADLVAAQLGRRDSPAELANDQVQVQDRADAVVVRADDPRPSIAVIWDPSVVDARTYRRLVTLLGDLARTGGGDGVELIRSIGFGVPEGAGVLR